MASTRRPKIIMGRKTFESLGGILSDRMHIILSRNPDFNIDSDCVKVVHSLLELQDYMEDEEEHFVIGGAIIYNLLMPYCKKMYVTQLEKDFEGDALFPRINEEEWKEVSEIVLKTYYGYDERSEEDLVFLRKVYSIVGKEIYSHLSSGKRWIFSWWKCYL